VVIVDSLPPPPASVSSSGWTNQMWSVVSGMLSVVLLTMGASWWWWLKSRWKLRHETAKMQEYLDDAASYRSAGTKVLNSHIQPHAHTPSSLASRSALPGWSPSTPVDEPVDLGHRRRVSRRAGKDSPLAPHATSVFDALRVRWLRAFNSRRPTWGLGLWACTIG
jgi:hypothetical protein